MKQSYVCAKCKGPLKKKKKNLFCVKCQRAYAVKNGIPILISVKLNKYLLDELKWHERQDIKCNPSLRTAEYAHSCARNKIYDKLKELGANRRSSILDVGIGDGFDMQFFHRVTQKITGVDISFSALRKFKNKYPYPVAVAEARKLPFTNESFDYVVISGVLHHIAGYDDIAGYLLEFKRVLAKGGSLIIDEPNIYYPIAIMMFHFNKFMQKIRPMWGGKVPHERPLSPFFMIRKLRKAGFVDLKYEATTYCHNKYPLFFNIFLEIIGKSIRKSFMRNLGWWIMTQAKKP